MYLTDLGHFPHVNEVMTRFFDEPYPARAAIGVASLPLGVPVEIDAILVLDPEEAYPIRHRARLRRYSR